MALARKSFLIIILMILLKCGEWFYFVVVNTYVVIIDKSGVCSVFS